MENFSINGYLVYGSIGLIVVLFYYIVRLQTKISAANENEEKLFRETYFDPITKLPNKKNIKYIFDEQISRTIRHNQSFTVLAIKINNYGKIKEKSIELAHKFIYEASNVIIRLTRDEDLVSCVDEDVFIILFNEYLEGDKYQLILQRLKDGFEQQLKGIDIECEVSMGVSQYPTDGTDADILIEKAILQALSKQF
ncbi:GGDEF domain-containing protein [Sulfurimonas sp.]|uniref:GGDEF domain-containing protein n=1 Tax=Sulfurimonas sp. TaxID=2022749 RepID=UPI003D1153C2